MALKLRTLSLLFLLLVGLGGWIGTSARPIYAETEEILAKTLYVSLEGSDSTGDGSWSAPYRTISKAASKAKAGDVIAVRGGVYTAVKQTITATGTAAQPIVIRPHGGETVILDGTGASISTTDSIINIMSAKHLVFEGFEIRNSTGRGLSTYESEYITVRNNRIHETYKRGMGGSGNYLIFEGNEVWRAVLENENAAVGEGNGGWAAAVSTNVWWSTKAPSSYITFRNNHIHDSWGEGLIPLHAENVLIEGNRIHDTFSINLYLDNTRNTRVLGNYLYSTTSTYNRPSRGIPANGISLANEGYDYPAVPLNNITIANNVVAGTGYGIGFWYDDSNASFENSYRNLTIGYNVIYNTHREALNFDAVPSNKQQPENVLLQNNILYEGQNGRSLNVNNPSGWQFQHNNWPNGVPAEAQVGQSFAADPYFVSPVIGGPMSGFQLQSHSTSIGAGAVLLTVLLDYQGRFRLAPPSVGIHEPNGLLPSEFGNQLYLPFIGR